MTYYSCRKSVLDGVPQAVVNKYGNRRQMERQYHLFCANANDGEEFSFDLDVIEWGTLETGIIERKVYTKPVPEPEVEPESEPEVEPEPTPEPDLDDLEPASEPEPDNDLDY